MISFQGTCCAGLEVDLTWVTPGMIIKDKESKYYECDDNSVLKVLSLKHGRRFCSLGWEGWDTR